MTHLGMLIEDTNSLVSNPTSQAGRFSRLMVGPGSQRFYQNVK